MLWAENVEPPFEQQEVVVDDISYVLPFLRVRSQDGEEIILHPFNTVVRQFDDEANDHLELTREGGVQGIPMDEDTLDLFIDYNFSFRWDKMPDKSTRDWLAKMAMGQMDGELEELLGE